MMEPIGRWAARFLAVMLIAMVCAPPSAEAQRGRGGRGGGHPRGEQSDDRADSAGPYGFSTPRVLQAIERGEGPQALTAYEEAAAEAEKAGALGTAVRAGTAGMMVAWRLGMLQKALALGTRVVALLPKAPPTPPVSRSGLIAYTFLGQIYQAVGDRPQARRILEEAVAFSRSGTLAANAPGFAPPKSRLLVILSQVESAQGERGQALRHAQEAVQLLESAEQQAGRDRLRMNLQRKTADAYMQLARLCIADTRLDAADAALASAARYAALVKVAEQEVEIEVLAAEVAVERGDAAGALALAGKGRVAAERLGLNVKAGELDRVIARASAALGKPDEALAAALSALARVEETRGELQDMGQRAGFLERRQGLYQFAVDLALAAGKPDEGFALAERSRSRAFLDLLGNASLSKGKTQALAQEEVRLRARLAEASALARADDDEESAGAEARVAAAEREYRTFLARVRAESVEQAALMSVEPVTLAEIQKILPADGVLLEYLVSAQGIVLWVVSPERVDVHRIAESRQRLLDEVRRFREAITAPAPQSEVEARGQALYRMLLGPAEAALAGRRLVIAPHDVLHYLPFAALRTPAGQWLVEAHALSTVPSASVLRFLTGKGAQSSDRVLAVGNPDLGPALALRYAEREARAIGDRYPTTSTVLVRADATKSRVKQLAGQSGLLHFAVHGELSETDPLASALLLTPGQGDDGRLEVRELLVTQLDARLVVLSACETGLGKLSRGDELVGLQRAFLYAGTPDVVTTLWKVDDRASFLLMREFYERLAAAGPMEALRAAQRGLMVDQPHPFAWAAFVLAGAPR